GGVRSRSRRPAPTPRRVPPGAAASLGPAAAHGGRGRAGGHRHRAGREARPTALGDAHSDSNRVGDPAQLPARDVELRALLLRADDRAGAVRVAARLRRRAGRSGLRAGARAPGASRRSMTTRLLARQSPVVIRLARFANATDRPVGASWASRLTRFATASPS